MAHRARRGINENRKPTSAVCTGVAHRTYKPRAMLMELGRASLVECINECINEWR